MSFIKKIYLKIEISNVLKPIKILTALNKVIFEASGVSCNDLADKLVTNKFNINAISKANPFCYSGKIKIQKKNLFLK